MTDPTLVKRPPARLYEVRTIHGEAYHAEGDIIESGDGWFTLWADQLTLALRIPEADIRAVRQIVEGELASSIQTELDSRLTALVRRALGIQLGEGEAPPEYSELLATACRELLKSEEVREKLRGDRERLTEQVEEARNWARHGYEIGQRHCGWSDHGVAPAWLTEGWPPHIDSCEHLKQAAEYDTALTRVREVASRLLTDDPVDNPVQATTNAGLRIREALGKWATA